MRFLTKAGAVSGIAVAAVMLVSGTAYATESTTSISGTCGTAWFTSSTVRETFTDNDEIEIDISSRPSGLEWALMSASTGKPISAAINITTAGTWYTLLTGVAKYTKFKNAFSCSGSGAFSGGEYY